MRTILRLQEAERLRGWPDIIPRSRSRGVKALGHRYEKAVAKQLGHNARQGVWWAYRDANGPGLCQTDFIIVGEVWAVILECKHTWTFEGMEQLQDLYIPVVEKALDKRAIGVQVCKHLTSDAYDVFNDLESAVNAARTGQRLIKAPMRFDNHRLVTLHWRGIGPLMQYKQREFA